MNAVAPSQDDLRELYRELILDHARSPRHFGKLKEASHHAEGINPLCGDKLKVYLQIDEGGTIRNATFEGSGCAISVASASLLTDTVIGLTIDQAMKYFSTIISMLTVSDSQNQIDASPLELDKLRALMGVKEFPARVKCATLAWHALDSAVNEDTKPATTE
jgi:nitrogen fixation NifU-like protein